MLPRGDEFPRPPTAHTQTEKHGGSFSHLMERCRGRFWPGPAPMSEPQSPARRPPGGSLPQTLKRTPATTTGAWDPVRYSGCVSENGRIAERWLVWSRAGRAQSHLLDLTRAERLRPRQAQPVRLTRPVAERLEPLGLGLHDCALTPDLLPHALARRLRFLEHGPGVVFGLRTDLARLVIGLGQDPVALVRGLGERATGRCVQPLRPLLGLLEQVGRLAFRILDDRLAAAPGLCDQHFR